MMEFLVCFYVSGDKLTMVVQGGSKNSLTSPYGLKAQRLHS